MNTIPKEDAASIMDAYAKRILKSKEKQHRECRSDTDQLDALAEVYLLGYNRGMLDARSGP